MTQQPMHVTKISGAVMRDTMIAVFFASAVGAAIGCAAVTQVGVGAVTGAVTGVATEVAKDELKKPKPKATKAKTTKPCSKLIDALDDATTFKESLPPSAEFENPYRKELRRLHQRAKADIRIIRQQMKVTKCQ